MLNLLNLLGCQLNGAFVFLLHGCDKEIITFICVSVNEQKHFILSFRKLQGISI